MKKVLLSFILIVFTAEHSFAQVFIPFSFWQKYVERVYIVFTANNASWPVPLNWNNLNNMIECIGAGGGGGGEATSGSSVGGNGGLYGGGGGGVGDPGTGTGRGVGAQGICVISYLPI